MYKKGVFEKKDGGLSLNRRGSVGVQYKKKKRGSGGPRNEKKEGWGQISKGPGSPSPSHF